VKKSNGDFAFHSDITTMSYYKVQKKPCDVKDIGAYDVVSLGWPIRLGASFKNQINMAISHIKLNGMYQRIKNKWWSGECYQFGGSGEASGADHAAAAMLKAVIVGLLLAVAMLY